MAGLLGNPSAPGMFGGLLGNPDQMPQVPFRQNPVVTAIGSSLLAGPGMSGRYDMSSVGPALVAKTAMQGQMQGKQEADAKRQRMNEIIRAWPGLSEQDRAFYRENPSQFDPAAFRAEAPKPTDDMREYDFAKSQGFDGSFTDFMTSMKKAGASSTNVTVGGEPFKPGQKKVDELYAQDYVDWRATGGFSDIDKQLGQLDEALKIIETNPGITGPIIGNAPDFVQAAINPDGTIAQNYVEEVVQRNLRVVLGPQFTEKEGERLIARAYNPRLPPAENAKRVRRLIVQIKTMAETKEAAADYFEQNGTLVGFQGRPPTVADIEAIDYGDGDGGAVGWEEYFK